mmetsp:Transcript_22263/g.39438  ORF Transcript_22263/g.39438 Transcript_22263/m.39438 type:complete len:204 (-) Transcript_22263:91-702(-)
MLDSSSSVVVGVCVCFIWRRSLHVHYIHLANMLCSGDLVARSPRSENDPWRRRHPTHSATASHARSYGRSYGRTYAAISCCYVTSLWRQDNPVGACRVEVAVASGVCMRMCMSMIGCVWCVCIVGILSLFPESGEAGDRVCGQNQALSRTGAESAEGADCGETGRGAVGQVADHVALRESGAEFEFPVSYGAFPLGVHIGFVS